jgi:hypothetical protein
MASNEGLNAGEVVPGDNCDVFYASEVASLDKVHSQIEILSLAKEVDIEEISTVNLNTTPVENEPKEDDNQVEEDYDDELKEEWKLHDKHVFILSEAGKPIYTL